jgi:NAD(P)-dependent dehydrogenase (short-subunit alcohol dehydrogenase family)
MTASLDVTDPTAATRVVSDAVDHFGRIDVLVNNGATVSSLRLRKRPA